MQNYIFSKNPDGSEGKASGFYFLIGRVKKVVLGKYTALGTLDTDYKSPRDIGKIKFEILYSGINMSKSEEMTEPAYPMFMFMKQYPLVSEIVYIVIGPDSNLNDDINNRSFYYLPPYATWGFVQHGAFPNLEEWARYIKDSDNQTQYSNISDKSQFVALPVGETYEEKRDVRSLKPFEGDTIIESRFGQSIRFGSSVVGSNALRTKQNTWSDAGKNGSPIMIMRNGQGAQPTNDFFDPLIENVNKDPSSIWLTYDQTIVFDDILDYPLASYYGSTKPKSEVMQLFKRETSNESYSAFDNDRIIVPGRNEIRT